MPRFSSPRGEQTHRRILDATLRVIASEGVRAVTHRRVALEAESASPGLITYYFPTTEDLITGALLEVAEREAAEFRRLATEVSDIGDDTSALVDLLSAEVMSRSADKKTETTANLALTLELAGQRFERSQLGEWEDTGFELAAALVRAVGRESSPELEFFVVSLLDGLFLSAVITPNPPALECAVRTGFTQLLQGLREGSAVTGAPT